MNAVAFGRLPDGTPVIISGGGFYDGTVRVWRLSDGVPVGEPLAGHGNAVFAVAFGRLPDGTPVIISSGDDDNDDNDDDGCYNADDDESIIGTVSVRRVADGSPVGDTLRCEGWAAAVAAGMSPDGTPVTICGIGHGGDGTVRVWRLADGVPVGEPLAGHDGAVNAVAFGRLPDGAPVVISGGGDGTVRVWRLADGVPVGEPLAGHDGAVNAVAFGRLPDGAPVVISGGGDGTVRVWRLSDGVPVGEPLGLPERLSAVVTHGNAIVTAAGADIAVHELTRLNS